MVHDAGSGIGTQTGHKLHPITHLYLSFAVSILLYDIFTKY